MRRGSGLFGAPNVNFTVNSPINFQFILAVLCFRRSSTHVLGSPGSAPRDLGVSGSLGGGWLLEAQEGLVEGETPKGRVNKCVIVVMGAQSRWGSSERRHEAPLRIVPPRGRKLAYFSRHPISHFKGYPCVFTPGLRQLLERVTRPEIQEVASGVR